jgi:undecaprenyl-diphosphatase
MRAAMLDLTALGDVATLTLMVAFSAGLLATLGRRRLAAFLLGATLSGALVLSLLKGWFERPRPMVIEHWATFGSASFPSGHAANSAIVYLSIAVLVAGVVPSRWSRVYVAAAAVLLVVAIGISRLYLGVHWPSDVLAGWAFGGGWALLCWTIAWRMSPRTEDEKLKTRA